MKKKLAGCESNHMSGLKKSRESYDTVDQEPKKKKMVLFFSPAVTQIWFTFLLALHSLRPSQPYNRDQRQVLPLSAS
jgi:hypothetical protein